MSNNPQSWSGLGLGTSGSTVAVARGVVTISIENSRNAVIQASKAMGDQIRQNIGGGTQQATRQAESSLNSLNNTLGRTARAFAAAFGIRQAISAGLQVQRLNALFVALTGSEEEATKKLDSLRDLADKTKQPFLDLAQGATALLPIIGRSNVDLAETVSIAQRLALLDPLQGIQGASIAIRELLSGEYRSLALRFEIPRNELRKLLEESHGDSQTIIDGLSEIVDAMGLTEDEFEKMGASGFNSFGILRSEMQETVALGITPLLNNAIIPMVSGFGDALRAARELNPQLVELTTTLLGLAAAGQAAQLAGVPGGIKAGLIGATVFGGAQLGVAASRGLAETGIIDRPELENISQKQGLDLFWQRLREFIVGIADVLVRFSGELAKGVLIVGNGFNGVAAALDVGVKAITLGFLVARDAMFDFNDAVSQVTNGMRESLAGFIEGVGKFISDLPIIGGAGEQLVSAAAGLRPVHPEREAERRSLDDFIRGEGIAAAEAGLSAAQTVLGNVNWGLTPEQKAAVEASTEQVRQDIDTAVIKFLGLGDVLDAVGDSADSAAAAVGDSVQEGLLSADMEEAFRTFQEDLADIEEKANEDRLEAVKDYEKSVSDATANFQRQRLRAAEDEARRRQKAEDTLADNISKAAAAGNQQIADLQNKAQEDTLKAEQDFQKRRQQQQRDMFRELRDAAANLDARRVFEILQKNREQGSDEREQFNEEKRQRQEDNQQRIQEIQRQTQERIQALRADFRESEAEYAEQRRIRMAREQEDFDLQLTQMDQSHQERLQKIADQVAKETQTREQAFVEQNNALLAEQGNHNERMINIQRTGTAQLEEEYRQWLLRMQQATGTTPASVQSAQAAASQVASTAKTGFRFLRAFQGGGHVAETGPIFAHRGEEVLPATASSLLRSRMGGEITPASLLQMVSAGSGGRSAQFGDINQTFNHVGGYTPEQLSRMMERTLANLLDRM